MVGGLREGKSWSNTVGGTDIELVANRKIVHTDKSESDDPAPQREMRVSILLTPVPRGARSWRSSRLVSRPRPAPARPTAGRRASTSSRS